MLLLSTDTLQREGPSQIHLHTIYMGRGYTVVHEKKKIKKIWTEVQRNKINN